MTSPRAAGAFLLLSPVGILLGWAATRLMDGMGDEPLWTIGHLLWLPAYALLALGLLGIHRRIGADSPGGRLLAGSGAALAVLGGAALTVQMAVDLVVGFATTSRPEMWDMFDAVQAVPGVEPAVYAVGPTLLFLGMPILMVHAAVRRRVPARSAVLVVAAVAVMVLDQAVGLPLRLGMATASVLLFAAMVPVRRLLLAEGAPAGAADRAGVR
ncbi:hypothetical protein LO763_25400 [Glycomyces sp. A-F 0318]|uniref:hypothetical protein n=1 Tax=Glycomyces amatae TaxID=2881355 RepID=UPI001E341284|nr:hypothetical protein [Glycomyces amatae]MCD0446961.1 hypothetical protein [Glycomyces amatae]